MKLTRQISVIIGLFFFITTHAQMTINNEEGKNVEKLLLDEFIGSGVEISNAKFNGSETIPVGYGKQIATYKNSSECGMLDIQRGLILSTDNLGNIISENLPFRFGNIEMTPEEINEFVNGFLKEQYKKIIEEYPKFNQYYTSYINNKKKFNDQYSTQYNFSEDDYNTLMELIYENPYFQSALSYYNKSSVYSNEYIDYFPTYAIFDVIKTWDPSYYIMTLENIEETKNSYQLYPFSDNYYKYYINTDPVAYDKSKEAKYEEVAKLLSYRNTHNRLKDKELEDITGGDVNSPGILEFDFTTTDDSIAFNYVFASQEYPDFVNTQFNDAFAFIITDLTTGDKENIAKVPFTNTFVSINNINQNKNSDYFIPNYQKTDKTKPIYKDCNMLKVGGFTTTLTAKCKVVPCRKYHLKMAVGNVSDFSLQSLVFLEAGSFKSNGISSKTKYSRPNAHGIANGCSNGEIVINVKDSDSPTKVKIEHLGSAKNGIDYKELPEEIVIPAHKDSVVLELIPLHDIEEDSLEIVMAIATENSCSSVQGDTIRTYIYKAGEISITPNKAECCATELSVEHTGTIRSIKWEPADLLEKNDDFTVYPLNCPQTPQVFTITAKNIFGCQIVEESLTLIPCDKSIEMTVEFVTENKSSELITECNDGKVIFNITRGKDATEPAEIKLIYPSDMNIDGLPTELTIPVESSIFELPVKALEADAAYQNTFNVVAECKNCVTEPITFEVTTTQPEKLELEQNNVFKGCEVKGMSLNVPLVSGKLGTATWEPADKLTDIDQLNAVQNEDFETETSYTVTVTDDRGCQTATAKVDVVKDECLEMTAELITEGNDNELIADCKEGKIVFNIGRNRSGNKEAIIKLDFDNNANLGGLPKELTIPAGASTFEVPVKALKGDLPYHITFNVVAECENCTSEPVSFEVTTTQLEKLELEQNNTFKGCEVVGMNLNVPLISGKLGEVKWEPAGGLTEIDQLNATQAEDVEAEKTYTITATDERGCQTANAEVVVVKDECLTMSAELITEGNDNELIADCKGGKIVFNIGRNRSGDKEAKIKLDFDDNASLDGLPKELVIPAGASTFEVPVKALKGGNPYNNTFNVVAECENCISKPVSFEITTTQLEKLELGQDNIFKDCEVKGMSLNVPLISGKLGTVTWEPAENLAGIDQLNATLAGDIETEKKYTVTATDERGCQTATAKVDVIKEECLEMTAELVTEDNGNELIADCKEGKVVFNISRNRIGNKEAKIKLSFGEDDNLEGLPQQLTIPANKKTLEMPVKAKKGENAYQKTFNVVATCENCISAPVTFEVTTTQLEKLELEHNNTFNDCEVKGMNLNVPLVSGKLGNVTWKPSESLANIDQLNATQAEDIEDRKVYTVTASDDRGCQTATAKVNVIKEECLEMTADFIVEDNSNELIANCKDGKIVFNISRNKNGKKDAKIKLSFDSGSTLSGLSEELTIPAAKTTYEVPVKAKKGDSAYQKTFNVVATCENCISDPITFEVTTIQLEKLELEHNNTFKDCEVKGMSLNVPLISGKLGSVSWEPSEHLTDIDQLTATQADDIESETRYTVTATDDRGCQTATTKVNVIKEECLGMTAELVTENNDNELITDCRKGKVVFNISRNRAGKKEAIIKLNYDSSATISGLPKEVVIPAGNATFEIPVKALKGDTAYQNTFSVVAECENCVTDPITFEVTTTQLEPLKLSKDTIYKECKVSGLGIEVELESGTLGDVKWEPTDNLLITDRLSTTISDDFNSSIKYTVKATDPTGCQTATSTVTILKKLCIDLTIPSFFTPNNDGNNDIWTVYGLEETVNSNVKIFDRWGKLIFEFNPNTEGWDGTYNGRNCPSTDYWYAIDCDEIDKVYTGHFTLLR